MSVLIKDMDMPKEGVYNAVITFDGDSISVRIPPSKKPFFSGRIVHIPTPHGRLIEEPRAIYYGGLCQVAPNDVHGITRYFIEQIQKLPTIIEAEANE